MSNRWRIIQWVLLLAGLIGIAVAIWQTADAAEEEVLPSAWALALGAIFSLIALGSAARSWVALFSDIVSSPGTRSMLRGTFYLSQLTKYLPAGGIIQTAGQLGLARSVGVPLKRSAVAFPVSVVGVSVACATLGSGLVFSAPLPAWVRVAAVLGLGSVVLLDRRLLAGVLNTAHRLVRRIPDSEQLPSQRDILIHFGWALGAVGGYAIAYAALLASVDTDVNPYFAFCAFAISWLIGYLVVPVPAGVGVREAVLLFLLPATGAAPLLAAALALRLLAIGTELLAVPANRMLRRRHAA